MSLLVKINDNLKNAMKAHDKETVSVLRLLISAFKYEAINAKKDELSDVEVISVLQKQAKQRKDSIESYEKANRVDLVEKEQFELNVIESYLPKPLSDEDLTIMINEIIVETGANSKKRDTLMREWMIIYQSL